MTIHEPAALITDYLLSGLTAVLAARLFAVARLTRSSVTWWWAVIFVATSISSACGGTVHGFQEALGPLRPILWLTTMESLVVAAFAVVRASVLASAMSPAVQRNGSIVAGLVYVAVGVWVMQDPEFGRAIAAYGSATVVLVLIQVAAWRRGEMAARWLLGGVALSIAAAVVQQARLAPHPNFNHNDLYHVIQAAAMWVLYRGAV